MIETNLRHADIIKAEPNLEKYKLDNQVDYQETIKQAYSFMVQDVKNRNFDVRRLCKRLWLQETANTVTATTHNSATSKEDRAERMRWVIIVSSLSGTSIFRLQGKNKSSDSWTDMQTVQVIENGTHKFLVMDLDPAKTQAIYKFYRIQKIDSASTVTYQSYLIETVYEHLHLWRTLALIYENLVSKDEDIFMIKSDKYMSMYKAYLEDNRFYYDADDDEEISETESEADYRQIVISRG